MEIASGPYRCEALERISAVPEAAWDALLPYHQPLLSHRFLRLLEEHGGICGANGWQPLHLTVWREDRLVGAAPVYLKSHSWGEFVFDWAWADFWERSGLDYYPKLLCAVPLTPVPGPRLLCGNNADVRALLARLMAQLTNQQGLSSAHINFVDDGDAAALRTADYLERLDWHFQWHNPGYGDFDDFLSTLTSKKRKNIRQERRRVAQDGWRFRRVTGDQASAAEWLRVHDLYRHTFDRKSNWSLLTASFFMELGIQLGQDVLLVLGERQGEDRAGALFLRSGTALHGRYWGTVDATPGLHFETCYYQGIEHAIETGLEQIDPGVQGQHKIARGFLPTQTRSFHYLASERMRAPVSDFLARERHQQEIRGKQLMEQSPFRGDRRP